MARNNGYDRCNRLARSNRSSGINRLAGSHRFNRSSGTNGVQGMIGAYGANTFRWTNEGPNEIGYPGNTNYVIGQNATSTINASKENNDGVDMDNWFNNLKSHIDDKRGDSIISLICLENPNKFFTGTIVHNVNNNPITKVSPPFSNSQIRTTPYWQYTIYKKIYQV